MSRSVADLQKQFKRGWYKKGNNYRFLHALDSLGFLLYQTKTDRLRDTNKIVGVSPDYHDWFDKAEYVGLKLPTEKD